jgi:hypothetical protein
MKTDKVILGVLGGICQLYWEYCLRLKKGKEQEKKLKINHGLC